MVIHNLALVLACVALPLVGVAQTTDTYTDPREGTLNDRYALGYFMTPRGEVAAQGSVFLVPSWTPGQLYLAGNKKPIAAPLKYDIYNQEVRARRPNGDSVAVAVAKLNEFSLGNRRFVCYPAATLPVETGSGCAEVLADGSHTQLLKFARKVLATQASQAGSYASSSTISVLEAHSYYYLRWATDGRLTPLRLKRASLEQALAGQPAALAALKARKGSLNSEADMAGAVAAIDPLLTAPTR
jgi:hypothetical protein